MLLVVTGTGTDVGKTVVTAAVATLATGRVAVVKPAQTGIAEGAESDLDVVRRLSGVTDTHEFVRYPEPLAPATAARRAGIHAMPVAEMAQRISALADHDLVIVEGAGGLLVHLDADGHTVADLAAALDAPVLVVAPAGLGALNATALTAEALRARRLACAGVVIGSWPSAPGVAEWSNLADFPRYAGAPLLGVVPAGSGGLERAEFAAVARASLAPELGGDWTPPRDAGRDAGDSAHHE